MAKQTKQQIKKHTEQEAKIIQEVEDDDTDEEVVEEVEDDDTEDDDDEEYKKALLMIGGSKTEPNTTTDIKKDLENGNYALYSLIVNGDNYKLCYDKNIYHFGNVSVPCGKKDNKTNYVLSYQYCVENKINSLNKIGNYVFGSSTNIYTKLKKV